MRTPYGGEDEIEKCGEYFFNWVAYCKESFLHFGSKLEDEVSTSIYLGVEPKIGGKPPKWMVKIMENPMNKWMIWGVFPIFLEGHPLLFYTEIERLEPENGGNLLEEKENHRTWKFFCFFSVSGSRSKNLKCSTPSIGLHVALVIENLKIEGNQELKQNWVDVSQKVPHACWSS